MAKGHENLIPIKDSEVARKLQGRSVQKRKENQEKARTFKEMLLLELDKVNEKTGKTLREELNDALLKKAAKGDTKAFEVVRDTCGEKPTDKVENSGTQTLDIKIQVME